MVLTTHIIKNKNQYKTKIYITKKTTSIQAKLINIHDYHGRNAGSISIGWKSIGTAFHQ